MKKMYFLIVILLFACTCYGCQRVDQSSTQLSAEEPFTVLERIPLEEELQQYGEMSIETSVLQQENTLYFGCMDRSNHKEYFYAFHLDTKEILWKKEIPRALSSFCLQDTVVYVGSEEILYALDASTGDTLWQYEDSNCWFAYPLVVDEIVYVYRNYYSRYYNGPIPEESDKYLYALDAETGELIWELNVDFFGMMDPPVYANNRLYFGTSMGNLYAVDATNGVIQWKEKLAKDLDSKTAYYDSILCIVGEQEVTDIHKTFYLYALNAETGAIIWSFSPPKEYKYMYRFSPVIADGVVYINSCSSPSRNGRRILYALDVYTGQELWQYSTSEELREYPVIDNSTIYLAGRSSLIALDQKTGIERWQYPERPESTDLQGYQYPSHSGNQYPPKIRKIQYPLYVFNQYPPYVWDNVLYFIDERGVYYAVRDNHIPLP